MINRLPRIGIRPTIDGRREGIRESLEEKTMLLAIATKKLIEENLRHSSGEHVEVIIAPTTIGGVSEAAQCETFFEQENVGVSLTVTPAWCYGTETIDMHPTRPKAIWGFNGSERPGAVYLAAALAAHAQLGIPAFGIYGDQVQDINDHSIPKDVAERILRFTRAGLVVATMKGKSYLSIGGVSMGIAGSMIQPELFHDFLGMRTEFVDMSEVKRRLELSIYDENEYQKAITWVHKNCILGADRNRKDLKYDQKKIDHDWEVAVKMTIIIRDLMVGNPKLKERGYEEESEGHNAIASGFQGQRAWTDFMPNGDFPETILNSSFDWNGIREPYIVATENDALNAIPMLFGHLLTGTASIFADVRTYWSKESIERVTNEIVKPELSSGIIHLINSGSAALDGTGEMKDENGRNILKPHWNISEEEVDACLKATRFCPANREYFRGGGFSTDFTTKGSMPVTMYRLNITKGLGPTLQIAEGHTVEVPENIHQILDLRTDPTWPTTWFVPRLTHTSAFKSVYDVMNNWGSNHCVVTYGHIGSDLITLASMLRIPVSMHNVPEELILRPRVWSQFGTQNKESADFHACETFGALYK